jgi:hypothetical protein
MTDLTAEIMEAALDYEFYANDIDDTTTLRDYLTDLLIQVIVEEESFNGKRPFGNSGWLYNFPLPLVATGAIKGTINEIGDGDDIEYDVTDYNDDDMLMALGQIIAYAFSKPE